MEKIVMQGPTRLSGEVVISGAKNSALPICAAAILGDGPSEISNVPDLVDVRTMVDILRELGADVTYSNPHTITIDPRPMKKQVASYDLVRRMRASICILGPLLGRFSKAKVSMPGGCVIGPRPIDLHIKGLRALNIEIHIENGYVCADGTSMKGGEVFLGGRFGSSVLATANVMMAAVKAPGRTVIESAACEPEVQEVARFLVAMGADIKGIGSHTLEIQGVERLSGIRYSVMPDRIEAGTFVIAAAITKGDVRIRRCRCDHLRALIDVLSRMGVSFEYEGEDCLRVYRKGVVRSCDVITLPYPGFPTDLQAQMMALMTVADGISVVTEKVYPERYMHVGELNRMAASISLEGNSAIIKGPSDLSGAPVMASDLRASAALILAGLVAKGTTEVHRIYHLDRGYERIEEKLSALGADIHRCDAEM